ncbi:hypothetical protein [Roseimarinus sediminis]|uniref:hypothetical protein n=1 Tax=Roseimarinus sediminis TaxID=1610899 RepID=UPI003D23B5EE
MTYFYMQERILTEDEYRKAIIRFLEICDANPGSPEYDEAKRLSMLMEQYENMSCFERRHLN